MEVKNLIWKYFVKFQVNINFHGSFFTSLQVNSTSMEVNFTSTKVVIYCHGICLPPCEYNMGARALIHPLRTLHTPSHPKWAIPIIPTWTNYNRGIKNRVVHNVEPH